MDGQNTVIFTGSIRRRTEFCAKIEVVGDPYRMPTELGGPPPLGFSAYGKYNGIDKDCYYGPGETPIAALGELPSVTQPPPISDNT
jgi:hypothetical protein